MLLTVTTTGSDSGPATDLGHLLHEHPDRAQSFAVAAGTAPVFYPTAGAGALRPAGSEYALGVEGLERLARGEPLRRVHECVFAVLALESVPVDPRL